MIKKLAKLEPRTFFGERGEGKKRSRGNSPLVASFLFSTLNFFHAQVLSEVLDEVKVWDRVNLQLTRERLEFPLSVYIFNHILIHKGSFYVKYEIAP